LRGRGAPRSGALLTRRTAGRPGVSRLPPRHRPGKWDRLPERRLRSAHALLPCAEAARRHLGASRRTPQIPPSRLHPPLPAALPDPLMRTGPALLVASMAAIALVATGAQAGTWTAKVTNVTLAGWSSGKDEDTLLTQVVEKFNQTHPTIHADLSFINTDYTGS